jgi:hypothetical protein
MELAGVRKELETERARNVELTRRCVVLEAAEQERQLQAKRQREEGAESDGDGGKMGLEMVDQGERGPKTMEPMAASGSRPAAKGKGRGGGGEAGRGTRHQ